MQLRIDELDYTKSLPELEFDTTCKGCNLSCGEALCGSIGQQDLTKMKLVVISDYPGYYELKNRYCMFSNEEIRKSKRGVKQPWPNAGNYIRKQIEELYNLDTYTEVYFTNIIKCNPQNKTALESHIRRCYQLWFSKELMLINKVNDRVPFLLLGSVVYKAFKKVINAENSSLYESKGLAAVRRKIHYVNRHPTVVTANPAAVSSSILRIETDPYNNNVNLLYYLPPIVGSPAWKYRKDLEVLKEYIN